jgi:hypothetical protein
VTPVAAADWPDDGVYFNNYQVDNGADADHDSTLRVTQVSPGEPWQWRLTVDGWSTGFVGPGGSSGLWFTPGATAQLGIDAWTLGYPFSDGTRTITIEIQDRACNISKPLEYEVVVDTKDLAYNRVFPASWGCAATDTVNAAMVSRMTFTTDEDAHMLSLRWIRLDPGTAARIDTDYAWMAPPDELATGRHIVGVGGLVDDSPYLVEMWAWDMHWNVTLYQDTLYYDEQYKTPTGVVRRGSVCRVLVGFHGGRR